MLQNLINSLNRDQLLAALNDPSVSENTLRAALFHCLNGAAETAAPTAAPAAPAAAPTPAQIRAAIAGSVPATPAAAAPAPAPAAPATTATPAASDAIVGALSAAGTGFAVADVITAGAEFGVTRSQASSAIKRGVKAGTLFGAGSRRFTRYGASLAIAQAASTTARG